MGRANGVLQGSTAAPYRVRIGGLLGGMLGANKDHTHTHTHTDHHQYSATIIRYGWDTGHDRHHCHPGSYREAQTGGTTVEVAAALGWTGCMSSPVSTCPTRHACTGCVLSSTGAALSDSCTPDSSHLSIRPLHARLGGLARHTLTRQGGSGWWLTKKRTGRNRANKY